MVDTQKGFTKTCYYELLEVDKKADTKTIEKVTSKFNNSPNHRPTKELP
jgi:hypothetical protein